LGKKTTKETVAENTQKEPEHVSKVSEKITAEQSPRPDVRTTSRDSLPKSSQVEHVVETDEDPWVMEKPSGRGLIFVGKKEHVSESPKPLLKRQVSRLLVKMSESTGILPQIPTPLQSKDSEKQMTSYNRVQVTVNSAELEIPKKEPSKTTDAILALALQNELVSRDEISHWMSSYQFGHESEVGKAFNSKYGNSLKQGS